MMQRGFRFAQVGRPYMNSMLMGSMARRSLYINPLINDGVLSNTGNNFLVMKDTDGISAPQLQFRSDGPAVDLISNHSLEQVERAMRREGMISRDADFYSPDGVRYAKSSLMKEIMQLPYFRLKIDGRSQEYHVHSSRAFNMSLTVSSPGEKNLQQFIGKHYDVGKLKGQVGSQLLLSVIERLQKDNADKTYSHNDVSEMLR